MEQLWRNSGTDMIVEQWKVDSGTDEQLRWNSGTDRVDQRNSDSGTEMEEQWNNNAEEQWNNDGGTVEQIW